MLSRRVRFELVIHSVHLHVEFPCSVSLGVRIAKIEAECLDRRQLVNHKAIIEQRVTLEADIPFDQTAETFSDRKGAITVFILSTAIGKNVAGVCHFEWIKCLEQRIPLQFKQRFERCPDKEASIEFSLLGSVADIPEHLRLRSDRQITIRSRGYHEERLEITRREEVLQLSRKSRSIWKHEKLSIRDSPMSHRDKGTPTLYTPVTSRVQETVRRCDEQGHRLQGLRTEVAEKERIIKRLESKNRSSKEEIQSLTAELDRWKVRSKAQQGQNQRLGTHCRTLQETIKDLRQFITKHDHDTRSDIQDIPAFSLEEQEVKHSHLEQEVRHYRSSKEEVQRSLKEHLRQFKNQSDDLVDVKEQLLSVTRKLESKEKFHQADLKKAGDRLGESEKERHKLEAEVMQLRAQAEQQNNKMSSSSKDKNRLINKQKNKLLTTNEQLRIELKSLTRFKEQYSTELHTLISTIDTLRKEKNHLQAELALLREKMETLEASMVGQKQVNAGLKEAINLKEHNLKTQKSKILQLEESLVELRQANLISNSELGSLRASQTEVTERLRQTTQQVKEGENRLEELHQFNRQMMSKQKMVQSEQQTRGLEMDQLMFQKDLLHNEVEQYRKLMEEAASRHTHQLEKVNSDLLQLKLKFNSLQEENNCLSTASQQMSLDLQGSQASNKDLQEKVSLSKLRAEKMEKVIQQLRLEALDKQEGTIEVSGNTRKLEVELRLKRREVDEPTKDKQEYERGALSLESELEMIGEKCRASQRQVARLEGTVRERDREIILKDKTIKELQLLGRNHMLEIGVNQSQAGTQKKQLDQETSKKHLEKMQADMEKMLLDLSNKQDEIIHNQDEIRRKEKEILNKEKEIARVSRDSLRQSNLIEEKENTIVSLRQQLQNLSENSDMREKRSSSLIQDLESSVQNLSNKITILEKGVLAEREAGYLSNIQFLEEKVKVLVGEREGMRVKHNKQLKQKHIENQVIIKALEAEVQALTKQKSSTSKDSNQHLDLIKKSHKILENKCSMMEKQLSDAYRRIDQFEKGLVPDESGTTFFQKSILQYQKISKQAINKIRAIQHEFTLTQAQKTKAVNKLRQFALILLRSKTKSLSTRGDVVEVNTIIQQYKQLQLKINQLVEYSFSVFEAEVPAEFDCEINQAMEEFAEEIAQLKAGGKDVAGMDPISKINRYHRSISLLEANSK